MKTDSLSLTLKSVASASKSTLIPAMPSTTVQIAVDSPLGTTAGLTIVSAAEAPVSKFEINQARFRLSEIALLNRMVGSKPGLKVSEKSLSTTTLPASRTPVSVAGNCGFTSRCGERLRRGHAKIKVHCFNLGERFDDFRHLHGNLFQRQPGATQIEIKGIDVTAHDRTGENRSLRNPRHWFQAFLPPAVPERQIVLQLLLPSHPRCQEGPLSPAPRRPGLPAEALSASDGNRRPAARIQRVLGIEGRAHGGDLFPFGTNATGLRVKLASQRIELFYALPVRINFKQLGMNGRAMGILAQGFDQDFLGLRIAAISHIHIGLGDRIDFIGIDGTGASLTEITRLQRYVAGVHTLTAGHPENRIRPEARRPGNRSGKRGLRLGAAPTEQEITCQQRQ